MAEVLDYSLSIWTWRYTAKNRTCSVIHGCDSIAWFDLHEALHTAHCMAKHRRKEGKLSHRFDSLVLHIPLATLDTSNTTASIPLLFVEKGNPDFDHLEYAVQKMVSHKPSVDIIVCSVPESVLLTADRLTHCDSFLSQSWMGESLVDSRRLQEARGLLGNAAKASERKCSNRVKICHAALAV